LLAGRDAAEKVPTLGASVTMLSVDSGTYTMLSEETAAQRARDLATLVPDDAHRLAGERTRLIDELRFSQLAQKRQLASSGVEAAARQLAGDTSELLASLRARGSTPPLASAHAEALADARLFSTLARRAGFVAMAAVLDDELRGLQATAVE
jgi:hypothetical protein